MKKTVFKLSLLIVSVVIFVSCSSDTNSSASKYYHIFPSSGDTFFFDLGANSDYEIVNEPAEWLTHELIHADGADKYLLAFKASQNKSEESRATMVIIEVDYTKVTLNLLQEGVLDGDEVVLGSDNVGYYDIGKEKIYTIDNTLPNWLTSELSISADGLHNRIVFRGEVNEDKKRRRAELFIRIGDNEEPQKVYVTQPAIYY